LRFDVGPEESCVFALQDLPLGADTFSAEWYPTKCASSVGASPTYLSNAVVATLTSAAPVSVSLQMTATSGATTVVVEFGNEALVPLGVRCVAIQATGATPPMHLFDVTPEESTVFALSNLPLGLDSFSAQAFGTPCSQAAVASATWTSASVSVSTAPGSPARLTLNMTPLTLTIVPRSATVIAGGSQAFTAAGGSPPYNWSLTADPSDGGISSSGVYTAGPTGGVTDVVQVMDSVGATATADVDVQSVVLPPPLLLSISPSSGLTDGGTPVTLTGANFQTGATVAFGSQPATVVPPSTATAIAVKTPAGTGLVAVTVTNPDGQFSTLPNAYTYVAPAPTIASISPTSGPAAGNTSVTITGSNFQPGATVAFGSHLATVVTPSTATAINVMTPAGTGVVSVTVTNPDGQFSALANAYTYVAPAPTIASISPGSGPAAGGTSVTITGGNFQPGAGLTTTVLFGSAPATNVQVLSATSISVSSPPGNGTVMVTVTNPDTQSVAVPAAFTYVGASGGGDGGVNGPMEVCGVFPVGNGPEYLAFDGTNIWVTNQYDATVSRLSAQDGSPQGTFAVGNFPFNVVAAEEAVFVANFGNSTVTKLRASDGLPEGTFPVGNNPVGLAYDGMYLWTANYSGSYVDAGTLTRLRASDGTFSGTFAASPHPQQLIYDGTYLWMSDGPDNTVSRLDPSDGGLTTFAVGNNPTGIAMDPAGDLWVANSNDATVTVLKPSDGTVLATYPVGSQAFALFAAGGIWVSNSGSNTVEQLSTTDGGLLNASDVPTPNGFTFDGTNIWVANFASNTVTRLCPAGSLDAGVAVSISPSTVAVPTSGTQQFGATVSGASNLAVTWAVIEVAGGSITGGGFYTAPTVSGTYHVQATSVADVSSSAVATVIVTAPTQYTLTISKTGTGTGSVTGGSINCGPTCGESVAAGTQVILTAIPDSGSTFGSWTGCDSSSGPSCTVSVTTGNRTVTVSFSPLAWVQISAQGQGAAALASDGTLWTWGAQGAGALCNGQVSGSQFSPAKVGTTTYAFVAATGGGTAAITSDGTLSMCGDDVYGQVGVGFPNAGQNVLVLTKVGAGFVSVVANDNFTMALKSGNALWGWGSDAWGEIGDGTTRSITSVPVSVASGYAAVAVGQYHTLAVKTDGTLWSWGNNLYSQLGYSTVLNYSDTPGQVGTESDWQAVAAAGRHSVALKRNGTVWTWGDNGFGEVGNGGTLQQNVPLQIGTGTYKVIAAAFDSTLAVGSDGSLWAWGSNQSGQLGIGFNVAGNETSPTRVGTENDWVFVTAGDQFVLAQKADGSVWAWGRPSEGELGIGPIPTGPWFGNFLPERVPNP
jgi:alpha-tubulin suppressor-like RCC1 family protein